MDAALGSVAGAVIWNATDAPVTVKLKVRVSPTAATVIVAVPAVTGVTVVVAVPVASVVNVVAPSVTPPAPLVVSVTVCPASPAPPAPLTTMVNVALPPPITRLDADDETVIVAPVMRIGICVDLPLAVAVIVAVRLVGLVDPAENVTLALPEASLTAELTVRKPVSAEKLTVTPDTAALAASTTVAVIVVVLLLSDRTLVDDALRLIAAAVGVGVVPVGGVVVDDPEPLLPPHAVNMTASIHDAAIQPAFERFLITRAPRASSTGRARARSFL